MLILSEFSLWSLNSVLLKNVEKSPERFHETSDENSGKCQSKLEKKFDSVVTSEEDEVGRDGYDDVDDEDDDDDDDDDGGGGRGGNNIDDGEENDGASAATSDADSDKVFDGNDDDDDGGDDDDDDDDNNGKDFIKYGFGDLLLNSWNERDDSDSVFELWSVPVKDIFLDSAEESERDSDERCGKDDDTKCDASTWGSKFKTNVPGVVFGMFSDAEPTLLSSGGGMIPVSSLDSTSP